MNTTLLNEVRSKLVINRGSSWIVRIVKLDILSEFLQHFINLEAAFQNSSIS